MPSNAVLLVATFSIYLQGSLGSGGDPVAIAPVRNLEASLAASAALSTAAAVIALASEDDIEDDIQGMDSKGDHKKGKIPLRRWRTR